MGLGLLSQRKKVSMGDRALARPGDTQLVQGCLSLFPVVKMLFFSREGSVLDVMSSLNLVGSIPAREALGCGSSKN